MTRKAKMPGGSNWSAKVSKQRDTLCLKKDIFKSIDPDKIASSLKNSALQSHKRGITLAKRDLDAQFL
jgi:hypothetical protein